MNQTIKTQLEHRTIRKWTGEELSEATRQTLLEVASRTATSTGLQHASIVRVTDPQLREELAAVGQQDYLARAPELWVFIADGARAQAITRERGSETAVPSSVDVLMQGYTDACLMAQNVVVAAESLGLGTNYYGCIINDLARVVEILQLPPLTFPVLGLGIGVPAQDPQLKPRMPIALRVSENSYSRPDSWVEALTGYDAEMSRYYDARDDSKPLPTFTDQMVVRMARPMAKRAEQLRVALSQGFDLGL